jgi:DNA polymerase-3 subunit gamma/tau
MEFEEMYGNEAEIESFKKTLEKENPPHTYLLIGPSGCGKTTLARIAARKLGADALSLTEINSADNRGIDTAREIITQLHYLPPGSGARVFIIDELHQTSKDWQNAMLKPLEDTPDHIYFFLCTTDPGKLIKAIRTRSTEIHVTPLNPDDLYRIILRVAKKESIELSKDILRDIAENADGSPRAALVLLEKVSEMDTEAQMKRVIRLGAEMEEETLSLCRALLKENSWKGISSILQNLTETDNEKVRYAVLGYMNSVLLKSGKHRAAVVMEIFADPFYNTGKAGLTLACYQVIADNN